MFNIGGGELLVIMLIALIVLGPTRLPDAARQMGKVMGDLRKLSTGFQNEMRSALDTADDPTRTAARRNVLAKETPTPGVPASVTEAVQAVSAATAGAGLSSEDSSTAEPSGTTKATPASQTATKKAPAKRPAAKKAPARKTSAKRAPAKKASAGPAPAKKAPAKKASAKKEPAKKAGPAGKSSTKTTGTRSSASKQAPSKATGDVSSPGRRRSPSR